jgi:uncharacterized protein with NRDE domain
MCLVLFAHDVHPRYRLVLAANRDEFHDRPTAGVHAWADAPEILAGRDLRSGGTWLGVTRGGRWAAVTNFRDPSRADPGPRSRGALVADFLRGTDAPTTHALALRSTQDEYAGFNLLLGEGDEVVWLSNRAGPDSEPRPLPPGIYGLSNHLLDTPWPKVVRGRDAIRRVLADGSRSTRESLLDLLLDRATAADHDLPATGVGLDLERALSASFISTPGYGTRSSSALLIGRAGEISFSERRFDEHSRPTAEEHLTW